MTAENQEAWCHSHYNRNFIPVLHPVPLILTQHLSLKRLFFEWTGMAVFITCELNTAGDAMGTAGSLRPLKVQF